MGAMAASCLCLYLLPPILAAPPGISVQSVANAWAKREKRFRTVKLKWTARKLTTKGSIFTPAISSPTINPKGVTFPPEDTWLEETYRLVFSDNSWRMEDLSHVISPTYDSWVPQRSVYVANGGVGKNLDEISPVFEYPSGTVNKMNKDDIPRVLASRLPFLLFRSFAFNLFKPSDYVVVPLRGNVDNSPCIILRPARESAGLPAYWVDPNRDFVLRRYGMGYDEKSAVDFTYKQNEQGEWLPSGWVMTKRGPSGQLLEFIEANVLSCTVNSPVPAEQLDLDFPYGTRVTDFTKPSELGDFTIYIVQAGGHRRIITPADAGVPYQQLLNPGPRWGMFSFSLLVFALVNVVLIAVVLVRVILRRREKKSGSKFTRVKP